MTLVKYAEDEKRSYLGVYVMNIQEQNAEIYIRVQRGDGYLRDNETNQQDLVVWI